LPAPSVDSQLGFFGKQSQQVKKFNFYTQKTMNDFVNLLSSEDPSTNRLHLFILIFTADEEIDEVAHKLKLYLQFAKES